jgi:hypothetical protein
MSELSVSAYVDRSDEETLHYKSAMLQHEYTGGVARRPAAVLSRPLCREVQPRVVEAELPSNDMCALELL